MKVRRGYRSKNVEDRRGSRGRTAAIAGGGGIIAVVAALLFGVLGGGGGGGGVEPPPPPPQADRTENATAPAVSRIR